MSIPLLHQPGGLRREIRRVRRGLRDIRDRAAWRNRRWCDVCMAGLATLTGAALLLVEPGKVDRSAIARVIRRRFSGAIIQDSATVDAVLSESVNVSDATELGIIRRGAEPLRIVIPPQRRPREELGSTAPMPICFS